MRPLIQVIATTIEGTSAALTTAVPLAKGCDAALEIVVPLIRSSAAEIERPNESTDLLVRRYRRIATALGADPDVRVCTSVGRDELVARIYATQSRVVIGGPAGRWLTSPEERFAGRLARAGCIVVFVASGRNTSQRRVAA
jgi:hypothetical protein